MARWSFASVRAPTWLLEDVYWWPTWRSPRVFSIIATLQVTAGQTYRLLVLEPEWEPYGQRPFVLTTSIESGPVALPPECELAPPGSNWVCVNEGWVPEDHPLALANPPTSPPPPVTPLPPLPPTEPPVVGPMGCTNRATSRDLDLRERRLAATGSSLGRGGTNESDTALDATRTSTTARATNRMPRAGSVRRHPWVGGRLCKWRLDSDWAPAGTSGAVKPAARRRGPAHVEPWLVPNPDVWADVA